MMSNKKPNTADLSQLLPHHCIDEFLNTMVHESNNFLSPISGFAELSLMEEPLDSKIKSYFEEILTASNRYAEFNQQLLMLSGKLQPMIENISSEEIVKLLEERNFDIQKTLTTALIFQANRNWLKRAIDGFRAFADGLSQHTIAISITPQAEHFVCRCRFDTNRDSVNLSEFFHPFYSSRKLTAAKGLGLCWLPAFMQSVGGVVELNHATDGGIDLAILFKLTESTDS